METDAKTAWRRIHAFVIDCIVVAASFSLIKLLVSLGGGHLGTPEYNEVFGMAFFWLGGKAPETASVIMWLMYMAYETVCTASPMRGTPGKLLTGFVVVDSRGNTLSLKASAQRAFLKYLMQLTMFISALMLFFSERQTTLHDMIVKSMVARRGDKFKRDIGAQTSSGNWAREAMSQDRAQASRRDSRGKQMNLIEVLRLMFDARKGQEDYRNNVQDALSKFSAKLESQAKHAKMSSQVRSTTNPMQKTMLKQKNIPSSLRSPTTRSIPSVVDKKDFDIMDMFDRRPSDEDKTYTQEHSSMSKAMRKERTMSEEL